MLDEFCANSGLARKYAIKILSAKYEYSKVERVGRKGRKRKYGHDFMIAAIKIWEVLDYPCGQRLQPALSEMYATLVRCKEMNFNEAISEQFKIVSGMCRCPRFKDNTDRLHHVFDVLCDMENFYDGEVVDIITKLNGELSKEAYKGLGCSKCACCSNLTANQLAAGFKNAAH